MKKKYVIIIVLLVAFFVNAQSSKKAYKDYNSLSYVDSAKEFLKFAEAENPTSEVLINLANAYFFNNKMEDASKWYSLLMAKNEVLDAELYYRYAMSLKTLLDYEESKKWMEKFAEVAPDDSRAIMFKNNPNYLEDIANASGNYELMEVDFNSPASDFGTSFYNDGIVFASSRGEGELYKWNEQPFLDLYIKKSDTAKAEFFSYDLNTKFHESSTSFSKDGNTIYFTRNNYNNGEEGKNNNQAIGLKIYKATKAGQYWTNITPLPFNSDDYNVAHPALSADGSKLYFASDMPGTLGKSDIYVVSVFKNGETFGKPENLGPTVNTAGKENFPFISDNGTLYFSSDGRPGLGGLDVFKVNFETDSAPINVGKPVNSSFDDFEFIIDDESEVGYFTSNRDSGQGDDDIYKIKVYNCKTEVGGEVVNKDSKEGVANAKITIYNSDDEEIQSITSDDEGLFSYEADCKTSAEYKIKIENDEYEAYDKTFEIEGKNDAPVQLKLKLTPLEPEVKAADVGTDLFKLLALKPINFDTNKAAIRSDAQAELQKIINYMKEFPTVKVEVRSHTDSRGKDSYNMSLSKKRNTSTKNWIITKGGIAPERISGKGFGETKLLNRCSNGVKCSKKEHAANRRSEFIVIAN